MIRLLHIKFTGALLKVAKIFLVEILLGLICLPTYGAQSPSPGDTNMSSDSAAGQYTSERPLVVGMLLFEGFEMLDVFGPLEMFGAMGDRVRIITVGSSPGLVKPRNGPAVQIEQSLADAEQMDLFIIPGGVGTRSEVNNTALLNEITTVANRTAKVASVCTGAALLARTGLLDGVHATTNKLAFEWVASQGPEVVWVPEGRWVDEGKYATSSGVSAGTDLALALIEQFFDRSTAEQIAKGTEYIWNDDASHDPFAIHMPK